MMEEEWRMGSLSEELEAREAAARLLVKEREAEVAELSEKPELARAGLEHLRITRETVNEVGGDDAGEAGCRDPCRPVDRG
ncbi:hypothetical protein [Streptomyces sp. NPDC055400]